MEIIAIVVAVVGALISLVGGIWFLVVTFQESIWWGLGCLLLPFVSLIFLITHWREASRPFGLSILGSLLFFVASILLEV